MAEMKEYYAKEEKGASLKFREEDNVTEKEKSTLTFVALPRCKTYGHVIRRIKKELLICQHHADHRDYMRLPKTFESLDDEELDAHIVSKTRKFIFIFYFSPPHVRTCLVPALYNTIELTIQLQARKGQRWHFLYCVKCARHVNGETWEEVKRNVEKCNGSARHPDPAQFWCETCGMVRN